MVLLKFSIRLELTLSTSTMVCPYRDYFSLTGLFNMPPFQLNALGLLAMMFGKEMDIALGSLVPNWAEMLPSFGLYVLANNDTLKLQSGFTLCNVTDGIAATDISSWFTRWLMSSPLTYAATTIRLRARDPSPEPSDTDSISPRTIAGAFALFMFFLPAPIVGILADKYGPTVSEPPGKNNSNG